MSKQQFEATEGLLEDVMRKQAGSIEKAVLEAVMNSIDANATAIEITVDEDQLLIEDDGDGMTKQEVESYFQKFGLKDDDVEEKEFGKFRMGRGQIFSFGMNVWHSLNNVMVVDLDSETTTVKVNNEEHELDTSGLSYNILESTNSQDGCSIYVELYNELEDVDNKVKEIKKLIKYIPWLHDVEISINGEELYEEFDYDIKTDVAYYKFDQSRWQSGLKVYNQGAYVMRDDIGPFKADVVTREDLDVNFARNDVLETCTVYRRVKLEAETKGAERLIDSGEVTNSQAKWLISLAEDGVIDKSDLDNTPLFEDVNGDRWTPDQLRGEKVSTSVKGDTAASDMQSRTGVKFINETFEDEIQASVEPEEKMDYDDVVQNVGSFEFEEMELQKLSSKRQKHFRQARWFLRELGCHDEVKPGYSRHAEAWRDGNGNIFIGKQILSLNKNQFLTTGLEKVLEVAAHDGDTRKGIEHNFRFEENYWKLSKNKAEPLKKLIWENPVE